MIEDWIVVYKADEEYQAEVVKHLLENAGLHPVLVDKKDDEFRIGTAMVYVAPEEVERAKEVLADNESE